MSAVPENAGSIAAEVAAGRMRAREVVARALDAARGDRWNAFLRVDAEGALREAAAIDEAVARGADPGPLAGVPVAVKDNIATRGVTSTAGSRILEDFVPDYDAEVVARLRAAGAVILGKTNLDEFGMGSSTENSAWGPARNPWDGARTPGGSSGGSAAAVAAGLVPLALGSETGGSVRQPAAFCGVVGLKPGYGRLSRRGLIAFGSSLDQVGIMARSVGDVALALGVMAGHDAGDSTSDPHPVPDYRARLGEPLRPLRVGLPREYFAEGLDAGVEAMVRGAAATLEAAGAEVVEVSIPRTPHAIAAYYLVATAEASANLARYDGIRYGYRATAGDDVAGVIRASRGHGFGPEVKRRIMLGTHALSAGYYEAYYLRAQQVRAVLSADFADAFTRCDVMLTPATPGVAFLLGEKVDDPLAMYLSDVYTCSANLAGVPALSMPAGLAMAGGVPLPVGVQLMAPPRGEAELLRVARELELRLGLDLRPTPTRPADGGAAGAP